MKNVKTILLNKVAKEAYRNAEKEANSACFCFFYQPVMPKQVKDLSKRK